MSKQSTERQRQSRFEKENDVVVVKFGGTSVEDAAAIRRLIGIVQGRPTAQRVVVVSALAQVTDQLLEAGKAAAAGRLGSALATVRDIYVRHERIADELVDGAPHLELDRGLRAEVCALESLLVDLESSRHLDARSQDQLLGFGECLSSRLVSAALHESAVNAAHVDARNCIVTDARHGQASPLWDETNDRVQENLTPLLDAGMVPVLGGFIAATNDGVPTTLGRGGSDFSAAIIGAALYASRVEIWTDVDGIMTTDPKLCGDARVIRKMTFEEAADLAHFGAKVLHPATLAPAMRENIPVYVLNSRRPEGEGTEIVARAKRNDQVSAITVKRDVAAVEIEAPNCVDSNFLAKVFAAFDEHFCPVDVMATSQGRMSLLVGGSASLPGIASALQGVAHVQWENHRALVCLIGENIRRQPDVARRAFAAVAELDVHTVCQGASERTISFLVEASQVEESVQRLHAVFFPKLESEPVPRREQPPQDWGGISSAFCQAG